MHTAAQLVARALSLIEKARGGSRKGQGKGRDGDGDGIRNETRKPKTGKQLDSAWARHRDRVAAGVNPVKSLGTLKRYVEGTPASELRASFLRTSPSSFMAGHIRAHGVPDAKMAGIYLESATRSGQYIRGGASGKFGAAGSDDPKVNSAAQRKDQSRKVERAATREDVPRNRIPSGAALRTATPKGADGVKARAALADKDEDVTTSWGAKLKARAGKDYILSHADNPGDRWVVRSDIFRNTYKPNGDGTHSKDSKKPIRYWVAPRAMTIRTLEGPVQAAKGDHVAIGSVGEMWPLKPENFAARYNTAPAKAKTGQKKPSAAKRSVKSPKAAALTQQAHDLTARLAAAEAKHGEASEHAIAAERAAGATRRTGLNARSAATPTGIANVNTRAGADKAVAEARVKLKAARELVDRLKESKKLAALGDADAFHRTVNAKAKARLKEIDAKLNPKPKRKRSAVKKDAAMHPLAAAAAALIEIAEESIEKRGLLPAGGSSAMARVASRKGKTKLAAYLGRRKRTLFGGNVNNTRGDNGYSDHTQRAAFRRKGSRSGVYKTAEAMIEKARGLLPGGSKKTAARLMKPLRALHARLDAGKLRLGDGMRGQRLERAIGYLGGRKRYAAKESRHKGYYEARNGVYKCAEILKASRLRAEPATRANGYNGYAPRPRKGGSILPKKGGQRSLMREAGRLAATHHGESSHKTLIRDMVDPKRPRRGFFTSGKEQISGLNSDIDYHSSRAKRLSAVAGYLRDRTKGKRKFRTAPGGSKGPRLSMMKRDGDGEAFTIRFDFEKSDATGKFVRGWASVCTIDGKEIEDVQGDRIDMEELRKAAHDYVTSARVAKAMHNGAQVGDVVESVLIDDEFAKAQGITHGKRGWYIGMAVNDPKIQKRVRSGELKAFSIGGSGKREDIAKNSPDAGDVHVPAPLGARTRRVAAKLKVRRAA